MKTKKKKIATLQKNIKPLDSNKLKSITGGSDRIWRTNSFEATTKIRTKIGMKQIVNVNTTDEVWNPINQQWMKVSRKSSSITSGLICEITTQSGKLTVTINHPFMKKDGNIVDARQLKIGDILENGETGDEVIKVTMIAIKETQVFHNLVFDCSDTELNNHFVEANGVVSGVLSLQQVMQQATQATAVTA